MKPTAPLEDRKVERYHPLPMHYFEHYADPDASTDNVEHTTRDSEI